MILKKNRIAGVDEVGKGSLFGPVLACAVVLDNQSQIKLLDAGLKDSKILTAKKRAMLVPLIQQLSKDWALGQASSREIDSIGIRKATEMAMLRALQRLKQPIDLVLVDGILPLRLWRGPQETLVHGESKAPEIAAASVLAKETRDALIKRFSKRFPQYGLETNVGYGTKFHRKILIELGATPLHRKSFLSKIII
mgnify:CR=1 FL=1